MSYYQEGCGVDSFPYDSVLKPNLSSANMRESDSNLSSANTYHITYTGWSWTLFSVGIDCLLNKLFIECKIIEFGVRSKRL